MTWRNGKRLSRLLKMEQRGKTRVRARTEERGSEGKG